MFKTYQEAYDTTVSVLNKQGARCTDEEGCCVYINEQGQGCAVGIHLPSSSASECSGVVHHVIEDRPELMQYLAIEEAATRGQNVNFWADMQDLHDWGIISKTTETLSKNYKIDTTEKLNII